MTNYKTACTEKMQIPINIYAWNTGKYIESLSDEVSFFSFSIFL